MTRPLSLAHLTVLDTTPPELVSVAAAAGFGTIGIRLTAPPSVGVPPYDILSEGPLLRETLGRLKDTGISVLDRASVDILDMVNERDSIQKALAGDTAALRAAMTKWAGPRNGEPLAAQRMFVGRDRSKSALMALSDPQGKVRLRLAVDSLGAARIEFLDAAGNVTRSLP